VNVNVVKIVTLFLKGHDPNTHEVRGTGFVLTMGYANELI
jgi:hypothetical protein